MKIASKMAMQRACRGMLMASSSSDRAGYLVRGIGSRRAKTLSFNLPRTTGAVANMYFFQSDHHIATSIGSRLAVMGLGRNNSFPVEVLIELLILSGIDIRRFSPKLVSFKNSDIIFLLFRSEVQA